MQEVTFTVKLYIRRQNECDSVAHDLAALFWTVIKVKDENRSTEQQEMCNQPNQLCSADPVPTPPEPAVPLHGLGYFGSSLKGSAEMDQVPGLAIPFSKEEDKYVRTYE